MRGWKRTGTKPTTWWRWCVILRSKCFSGILGIAWKVVQHTRWLVLHAYINLMFNNLVYKLQLIAESTATCSALLAFRNDIQALYAVHWFQGDGSYVSVGALKINIQVHVFRVLNSTETGDVQVFWLKRCKYTIVAICSRIFVVAFKLWNFTIYARRCSVLVKQRVACFWILPTIRCWGIGSLLFSRKSTCGRTESIHFAVAIICEDFTILVSYW